MEHLKLLWKYRRVLWLVWKLRLWSIYYRLLYKIRPWNATEESFATAWEEARQGRVHPVDTLWDAVEEPGQGDQ